MRPEELIRLLTSKEQAELLAGAIADPALQAVHGWDLADWSCRSLPGALLFVHHEPPGTPSSLVVALSSPEQPPDEVTHLLAQRPLPLTVVVVK